MTTLKNLECRNAVRLSSNFSGSPSLQKSCVTANGAEFGAFFFFFPNKEKVEKGNNFKINKRDLFLLKKMREGGQ